MASSYCFLRQVRLHAQDLGTIPPTDRGGPVKSVARFAEAELVGFCFGQVRPAFRQFGVQLRRAAGAGQRPVGIAGPVESQRQERLQLSGFRLQVDRFLRVFDRVGGLVGIDQRTRPASVRRGEVRRRTRDVGVDRGRGSPVARGELLIGFGQANSW